MKVTKFDFESKFKKLDRLDIEREEAYEDWQHQIFVLDQARDNYHDAVKKYRANLIKKGNFCR